MGCAVRRFDSARLNQPDQECSLLSGACLVSDLESGRDPGHQTLLRSNQVSEQIGLWSDPTIDECGVYLVSDPDHEFDHDLDRQTLPRLDRASGNLGVWSEFGSEADLGFADRHRVPFDR